MHGSVFHRYDSCGRYSLSFKRFRDGGLATSRGHVHPATPVGVGARRPPKCKKLYQVMSHFCYASLVGVSACSVVVVELFFYSWPFCWIVESVVQCMESNGLAPFQTSVGISVCQFMDPLTRQPCVSCLLSWM